MPFGGGVNIHTAARGAAPSPAAHGFDSEALTAFARVEDRNHAVDAGFQLHLAKPAVPAELVTVVATLAGTQVPRGVDAASSMR